MGHDFRSMSHSTSGITNEQPVLRTHALTKMKLTPSLLFFR